MKKRYSVQSRLLHEESLKRLFIGTIDAANIASSEGMRVRDVLSGILAALSGERIVACSTAAVPEPITTLGFV